jgi:hypothetical protein
MILLLITVAPNPTPQVPHIVTSLASDVKLDQLYLPSPIIHWTLISFCQLGLNVTM